MKRNIFILLALGLSALPQTSAQTSDETVEIDGIYYKLHSGDPGIAELALPYDKPDKKDFKYSGAITIPSKVSYESAEYIVNGSTSVFTNSEVTELTMGAGFEKFYIYLTNDACLEKITVNETALENPGVYDYVGWINVGNNPGCAYVTHCKYEDRTVMHIESFNVYGPDGQQLKPFLAIGEDTTNRLYPDEDGNFVLDENYRLDGQYCMILPISSYVVVYLYCEVTEGQVIAIRCQPDHEQTGIYTTVDNIRYMIAPQYAVVDLPEDGQQYTGDIMIPEVVTYDGKEIPVTKIAPRAFEGSGITSITLPSSIESIGDYAFRYCDGLKSADLSACSLTIDLYGNFSAYRLFQECKNLTDVLLPESLDMIPFGMFYGCSSLGSLTLGENVKQIEGNAFSGCESLTTLAINEGTVIDGAFYECPALVKTTVLESTEETVKIKFETALTQTDGTPLIPQAYTAIRNQDWTYEITMLQLQDGVATLERSGINANEIYVYANNSDNTYLPEPGSSNPPSLCTVAVPEPGEVNGVTDGFAVCDDDAPATFYNLQGSRVSGSAMRPGIYIKVQGSKASKVIVR